MAMDGARCNPGWLLARMGAISRAGLGLFRALGKEQQRGQRVRSVVPEPVSAVAAVRRESGRVSDSQLYTDARNHDPGLGRGPVASRSSAADSDEEVADRRCGRNSRRLVLHFAGICPIVKRIWTPSWTLFSGGLCFLILAGLSWLIDVRNWRRWTFPFIVIGRTRLWPT